MKTAYILDDNLKFAEAISSEVKSNGYQVTILTSPDEVLERYHHEGTLDLLITDIRLTEGRDGFDLVQKMRHRGYANAVIAISGYADQPMLIRAFELGICDFLEKPFTLNRFGQAMGRANRLSDSQRLKHEVFDHYQRLFASMEDLINTLEKRCVLVEDRLFSENALSFPSLHETRKFVRALLDSGTTANQKVQEYKTSLQQALKAMKESQKSEDVLDTSAPDSPPQNLGK